jgi:hypothetical protein
MFRKKIIHVVKMINEKVLRKVVEAQTGRGVFEVEEDACIFF